MDEKKKWIRKLQEDTEIPDIVWQKAEQSFQKIQEDAKVRKSPAPAGNRRHRRSKKAIFAAILAATLLISTLTVGAAAYFYWNDKFSEYYNVTPRMEQKLNDSNTAKEINQSVEHDGLRIEAVQTLADNNLAHIVLKVWGSEDLPFNTHMNFESVDFQVEGNPDVSWFGNFLDGLTDEDCANGAEYEIILQDAGEKGLLNKEVKLTFHNVIDEYEGKLNETEPPVLLDSTWELTLTLDNEDTGKVYQVDRQIEGSQAVVRQIRLSPISFTIDFDWTYQTEILSAIGENGEEETFEHTISPPEFYGVVYEDSSIYEGAGVLNGRFTNEERTQYQGIGYYPEIIEYENVSELIFLMNGEKVRVPVKK